jgi:hypothetical protein
VSQEWQDLDDAGVAALSRQLIDLLDDAQELGVILVKIKSS